MLEFVLFSFWHLQSCFTSEMSDAAMWLVAKSLNLLLTTFTMWITLFIYVRFMECVPCICSFILHKKSTKDYRLILTLKCTSKRGIINMYSTNIAIYLSHKVFSCCRARSAPGSWWALKASRWTGTDTSSWWTTSRAASSSFSSTASWSPSSVTAATVTGSLQVHSMVIRCTAPYSLSAARAHLHVEWRPGNIKIVSSSSDLWVLVSPCRRQTAARGFMFSCRPHVRPSDPFFCTRQPWGNFFKFHLNSRMNWFDLNSLKTKVKVTVTSQNSFHLRKGSS